VTKNSIDISHNMSPPLPEQSEVEVSFEVSRSLFSNGTIMRAAHRLTGECYIEFAETSEKMVVKIRAKLSSVVHDWKGRFLNDLLDEELRERIAKETEAERTLIMAHALSKHPVINCEFEMAPAFSTPVIENMGR